ncbi:uncharacterized protein LOC143282346 [Babylonia areolata]|uniref:uncharacterized protein LOC143282346 n=1 Tax=Babylonia areolata TaxID=304850 RepID=UPI003FD26BAF
MGEEQGSGSTIGAEPSGDHGGLNTTTTPSHMLDGYENLQVYDFVKMTSVDWDKVYDGHMNQLQFISWNGLNIGRLTLAIWILATHLALILLMVAKGSLRSQPKNVLIINVSLTNLLMGVFIIPTKLHFILGPGDLQEEVECGLRMGWTLLNDYYQVCVCLLAVLGLVLERLVYVHTERRGTSLTRCATWLNCALYFLLPWALSALLLVPLFHLALAGPVPGEPCAFRVRDSYFLAAHVLSFLPAAVAVFVAAPLAGLLDCVRSEKCTSTPSTPRGESLLIAVLLSALTVFGETPYFVVRVLVMCLECDDAFCSRFQQGVTAGMWLRIAKAALMPFLWLVYSDVRDALLCRFRYKRVKNSASSGCEEDEDDYHLVNTRM